MKTSSATLFQSQHVEKRETIKRVQNQDAIHFVEFVFRNSVKKIIQLFDNHSTNDESNQTTGCKKTWLELVFHRLHKACI